MPADSQGVTMTSSSTVKHNAKDSVFADLFTIPEYLLELYQTLHPEDTTSKVENLKSVTSRCVLAGHLYNDLGFIVQDKLILLVEAQSSWSPNIVLRLLMYMAQSLNQYFNDNDILLYSNSKAKCPKPELYVIYTGERKHQPQTLSLKDLFFPNDPSCDIDVRVHMIYEHDSNDIINQYIVFCKVLTAQIKEHGYTKTTIENTLRICQDKNILTTYLKQRETEVMDIMTSLFDQDHITYLYGLEKKEEGKIEGIIEGKIEGQKEGMIKGQKEGTITQCIDSILHLTQKLHISREEAMELLEITGEQKNIILNRMDRSENDCSDHNK